MLLRALLAAAWRHSSRRGRSDPHARLPPSVCGPSVGIVCRRAACAAGGDGGSGASAGIQIGDVVRVGSVSARHAVFTQADVDAFVSLTGDANRIHALPNGAIVPGILVASLFPAVIGSEHQGALYLSQELAFRAKVRVGDAVRAEVTVKSVEGRRVTFQTRCFRSSGDGTDAVADDDAVVVIDGTALALLRRQRGSSE